MEEKLEKDWRDKIQNEGIDEVIHPMEFLTPNEVVDRYEHLISQETLRKLKQKLKKNGT